MDRYFVDAMKDIALIELKDETSWLYDIEEQVFYILSYSEIEQEVM